MVSLCKGSHLRGLLIIAYPVLTTRGRSARFPPHDPEVGDRLPIFIGGIERRFNGERYVVHWAIPNFYFHIMAVYSILRENGVEVGKMDYLGKV